MNGYEKHLPLFTLMFGAAILDTLISLDSSDHDGRMYRPFCDNGE